MSADTRPGPRQCQVDRLERRWREATGRNHIVACRSATAAMRLAAHSLGLGRGDEFICPADAFLTALLLAAACGAEPVLVDLDPHTLQVDPALVEAAITPRTRLVLAVDRYGTTPDFRALGAVSRRNNLQILEDGSQARGARFEGRPVGSLGTAAFFTLGSNRHGSQLAPGCIFAADGEAAEAARRLVLADEGLFPAGPAEVRPAPGHSAVGHSAVCHSAVGLMSEFDAAVANARLATGDHELAGRSSNGAHLIDRLTEIPGLDVPTPVPGASHVYSWLPVVVRPDELGVPEAATSALRDTLIDVLAAEGLWLDRWAPQPVGGELTVADYRAAVDEAPPTCRWSELPATAAVANAAFGIGSGPSPLGGSPDRAAMDSIVDCFEKVLVDHLDRLRQLTRERATRIDLS